MPSRLLSELLADVEVLEVRGDPAGVEVNAVEHDSRAVRPGALFVCLRGQHADGHHHAGEARARGGVAAIVEEPVDEPMVQVRVRDGRAALAQVAAALHGHPARAMVVAGVTGTNGKTTTVHLLASVFEAHGWPAAAISTIGGPRSTPEAPALQARLAAERDAGRAAVAMEVSSHALVQRRVDAVHFAVVGFTNLTPEHRDFHGDMESYYAAKATLFEAGRADVGVVNADDAFGLRLLGEAGVPTVAYSAADAKDVQVGRAGTTFVWEGEVVRLRLAGRLNVANALCAATMAREIGIDAATVAGGLSAAGGVAGRFELVDAGQPFLAAVDYAHTPDGLEQLLVSARELADGGRVIVVFGCGGDRDREKRPVMGELAARLADVAVATSDNPRHEDPLAILAEVAGRAGEGLVVEVDRRTAIEMAVSAARPGDVVVVAGKGHEQGQVVGDRTLAFDDREVLASALRARPAP